MDSHGPYAKLINKGEDMLDKLGAKLAQWGGLTGMRERHTTGERNWAVGLALTLGFTLGIILVLVTGGVQC